MGEYDVPYKSWLFHDRIWVRETTAGNPECKTLIGFHNYMRTQGYHDGPDFLPWSAKPASKPQGRA